MLCAGLWSSPTTAFAQSLDAAAPATAEGRISDVRLVGLRNVEEAAMLAVMATRAGALANPRTIQRDIKAIYRSGFVDNVVVDVVAAEDGVVVTF
ncbi:MAG TPA: hypothetical protein DFR83_03735, partial [Deltaproteobacteria bacterium]|nr:hypothetical protein [Deltaproteobacteria bacterium]